MPTLNGGGVWTPWPSRTLLTPLFYDSKKQNKGKYGQKKTKYRTIRIKTKLWVIILEEDEDLACITETWINGEGGPPLALICLPGYAVQHQGRLEGRGGGVAIVYKSNLEVTRLSLIHI